MQESYGALVRRYREATQYSVREFAKKIGYSVTHLSDVERGLRPPFAGPTTSEIEMRLRIPKRTLHRAAVREFCEKKGYTP